MTVSQAQHEDLQVYNKRECAGGCHVEGGVGGGDYRGGSG